MGYVVRTGSPIPPSYARSSGVSLNVASLAKLQRLHHTRAKKLSRSTLVCGRQRAMLLRYLGEGHRRPRRSTVCSEGGALQARL